MADVKDGFTTDDILPGDILEGVNEWIDGGPKSRLVEMRLIRNGKIIAVARPQAPSPRSDADKLGRPPKDGLGR